MNENTKIGVVGGDNNLRAMTTLKEAIASHIIRETIQSSGDNCIEVDMPVSTIRSPNRNKRIYDFSAIIEPKLPLFDKSIYEHPKPNIENSKMNVIFPRGSNRTFRIPYGNIDFNSNRKLSPFLQAYYDFGIRYTMGKSYGWCDMTYSSLNDKDGMKLFAYRYMIWFFNLFMSNKYSRYIPMIPVLCTYQTIMKGWWWNA